MALTPGLQLPYGVQPVNPVPVDSWSGPYIASTLAVALQDAKDSIPLDVRFRSMEVRLVVNNVSFKYWFKNGTTDPDLIPFSAGATSSVNVVTGNTNAGNAADTNYIYLVNGAFTITMPTAVGNNNSYTIKRIGAGTVSIATTASQTIDGSSSPITINVQYVSITLVSDGANWFII
jgi:hypothetical protein